MLYFGDWGDEPSRSRRAERPPRHAAECHWPDKTSSDYRSQELPMLVLSRRRNEKIVIPSLKLTLEVLTVKGDSVRLGFEAPAEVAVRRGEVQDERQGGTVSTGQNCQ
jgi:carbon storage regulator